MPFYQNDIDWTFQNDLESKSWPPFNLTVFMWRRTFICFSIRMHGPDTISHTDEHGGSYIAKNFFYGDINI